MFSIQRIAIAAAAGMLLAACVDDAAYEAGTLMEPPSLSQSAGERYIVVLKDGIDPTRVAASHGLATEFVYRSALTGFAAAIPDDVRRTLEQSPAVRWLEPVRMHQVFHHRPDHGGDKPCRGKNCGEPPPPTSGGCTAGPGDPSTSDDLSNLWGIRRVNASQSQTWINEPVGVDIAILDTGADLDHPDLCIQSSVSFDPFERTADDNHGHGTHTAGTAAARDDNGLVVGVSPEARIWVVKVCNGFGFCDGAAIVAGIDYVTANADQIDVANMSLGGGGSDQPHAVNDCEAITGDAEHLAICRSVRAGVTYVVAAGNSGADAAGFVPAAYDEVVTVAASDSLDNAAGFSNFGADVDVIAPGVSILSDYLNGGTARMSGTSMASPHAAGGAALYIAQQMNLGNPRPDPFAVRDVLVATGQAWGAQGGSHPEPLLDVSTF